jgi:hypothetical protein
MISLVDIESVIKKIARFIADHRPFSLVRIGDGEYQVLRYPEVTSVKVCRERIGRWFPAEGLSADDIAYIRKMIYDACIDADFLGLPNLEKARRWPVYKGVLTWLQAHELDGRGRVCFHHMDLPLLEKTGEFRKLLHGAKFVGLITCRDVAEKLKASCGIKHILQWRVAGERFKYKDSAYVPDCSEPHWPDGFKRIEHDLHSRDCRGEIWLVGAGGLAKAYCRMVKKQGGMALDIGTLFDGWAGVDTRPYLHDPSRYAL